MYAAEPTEKPQEQSMQNEYQQLVSTFLRMDPSSVDAFWLIQIAAYLYVYDNYGIQWFDFELWSESQGMMAINYFLKTQARNIGFLANDEWANEQYFQDKASVWEVNYPDEHAQVYNYVTSVQAKYHSPATANPIPAKTPEATIASPKPTPSAGQCDMMYNRLMDEYYALIAIKDVPYAKIADVKERIHKVQQWDWCTVAAAVAVTQQDIQKQNQTVTEKVRRDLNFGSANMRVIPDNIVPPYCEDTSANVLRSQLSQIDDNQMIRDMKNDLENLMQSQDIVESLVKRNVVGFVAQELTLADSENAAQQWDAASVFHNMAQWLVLVGDGIANARWIYQMIDLAHANIDKLSSIGSFLGEEFEWIKSLKSKWNANYNWNEDMRTFVRTENSDGVMRFALPASKEAVSNNATFTLATAKTKFIQVSEQPYTWTEYAWEISLEQFIQEAKNNWSVWGNSMDAATLGKVLTQEVIAYAPEYYTYNDPNQPVVFFAEANGEQKVFKDHNLTHIMPAGTFANPRWTTYVIGEEGKLISMVYTEEAPEAIKAKLEVDGRIVIGVDLSIVYDEQAIRDGYGSSFPLSIRARVFVRDYLITLNAVRSLEQSVWSASVNLQIQWPTICEFSLGLRMRYAHDGAQWYPTIDDDTTNITQLGARLSYNNNTITVDVSDMPGFVSSINDAVMSSDGDMLSAVIDPINTYVVAWYYFDDNKLADILADADSMVVVQYTNNNQREPIMDVFWWYFHLLRIDHIMSFVQPYMGGGEKDHYDGDSKDGKPYDGGSYNNYQLNMNNYYRDDQYVYASYSYVDNYGNGNEIYPDKLSVEAMTASGPVSYQFEWFDMYTYRAPVAYLLSDANVYAAYIYATYNGYDNTTYIIGTRDDYHNGYQSNPTTYSLWWQSTSYPDVWTQEIVLSLYEYDMFVQYIEARVLLHMTYGTDCDISPELCSYADINIYATYLDGIPTYILDTLAIDDPDVYSASISISYSDPAGYEHIEKYGLKKPQ
jgi:hypothetical protein